MKRRRNRMPCSLNNRWYERYGKGGYFCMPRDLLFNLVGNIHNAPFYTYVALASCHFEGQTTYAGKYVAQLVGKDESGVRGHLKDLETLGLIRREPLGQGFKVLFLCPDRKRIREGAARVAAEKLAEQERSARAKAAKASSPEAGHQRELLKPPPSEPPLEKPPAS